MPVYAGSTTPTRLYAGTDEVIAQYLGSTLVYSAGAIPEAAVDAVATIYAGVDLVVTGTVSDTSEDEAGDGWNVSRLSLLVDPDGSATAPTEVTAWAEQSTGVWAYSARWSGLSAGTYLVRCRYTNDAGVRSGAAERIATVDAAYVAPWDDYDSDLDYYYAMVQLRSGYTGPLVRGYRVSDAAEADFSPTNGRLVDSDLTDFALDPATGLYSVVLVKTRYSQKASGGIDLTQTDPALMPTLVDLITEVDEFGGITQTPALVRDNAGYVGVRHDGNATRGATYLDADGIPSIDGNDATLFALIQPTTDTTNSRRWIAAHAPAGNNRAVYYLAVSSEASGIHRIAHGTGSSKPNELQLTSAVSRGLYVYRTPGTAPSIRRGNNELGTDPSWSTFTGGTADRLRVGAGTHSSEAVQGFDGILSLIAGASPALDSATEDAMVTALNAVLAVAPVGADADAVQAQNTQAAVDLRNWHADLVQGDFTFTMGQSLSFDDTGLTDDEVFETHYLLGAGYNGGQATHCFLAHPKFSTMAWIERNDRVYGALNKSASPRVYVYGGDCAWIYDLAAPGITNPYYGERAVMLKAWARIIQELIIAEGKLYDSYAGRWEYLGKILLAVLPTVTKGWAEVGTTAAGITARRGALTIIKRIAARLGEVSSTLNLVNKEAEGFEALLGLVPFIESLTGDEEDLDFLATLLPTANAWLEDTYFDLGAMPEGKTVEQSYEGRTVYAMVAKLISAGADALSLFGTKLRALYKRRVHEHVLDFDDRVDAGSGSAGRTAKSVVETQMSDRTWRDQDAAILYDEAKPLLSPSMDSVRGRMVPADRATAITEIQARITDLNTTAHEKSYATGGFAGAVYEPDAATWESQSYNAQATEGNTWFAWPEQYPDYYTPNLYGDLIAARASAELPHEAETEHNVLTGTDSKYFWSRRSLCSDGTYVSIVRFFVKGGTFNNWGATLESVSRYDPNAVGPAGVDMGITALSRHNKGGGGQPTSDGYDSTTPEDTRRYNRAAQWLTQHLFSAYAYEVVYVDTATNTIGVRDTERDEGDVTDAFVSGARYRVRVDNSATDKYVEWAEYDGTSVSEEPGVTLNASPTYDAGNDWTTFTVDEDIDSNDGTYVGITVGAYVQWAFSTAIANDFEAVPTLDGDGNCTAMTVTHPLGVARTMGGAGYIPNDVEAELVVTATQDGETGALTVTAGVLGQAAKRPALDWGFYPVHLRDGETQSQSDETTVEAWDATLSGWVLLDEKRVTTDELRLTRNGATEYLHLSRSVPVHLGPRFIQAYQTPPATHGRVITADLHDDRGTPTAWESSVALTYTLDLAAPSGKTAVAPSAVITHPREGAKAPVGEPFFVTIDYRAGDAGLAASSPLQLQYSTDGGSSFSTAATAFTDNGDGTAVHLYDTIPAGITHLRAKVTPASGTAAESFARSVVASTVAEEGTDYFTDSDGTALSAHTPDLDTEGSGYAKDADDFEVNSNRGEGTGENKQTYLRASTHEMIVDVTLYKNAIGGDGSTAWPRVILGGRQSSNASYVYVCGGATAVRIGEKGDTITESEFTRTTGTKYRFRARLEDGAAMAEVWVDDVAADPVYLSGTSDNLTTDTDRRYGGFYAQTGQQVDDYHLYSF